MSVTAESMLIRATCLSCAGFHIVSGAIRVQAKAEQHAREYVGHRIEVRHELIQIVQATEEETRTT